MLCYINTHCIVIALFNDYHTFCVALIVSRFCMKVAIAIQRDLRFFKQSMCSLKGEI